MAESKGNFVIGIAGGSASGKTSICKLIAEAGLSFTTVVCLDWFYKDLPPGVSGDTYDWDHPDAFDWNEIRRVLSELIAGRDVMAPGHDYKNYKMIPAAHKLYSLPLIIFEGIFAHDARVRDLLNLKLFVDCDSDMMLKRRIIRDVKERGYDVNLVLERYEKFVKPAYETHIKPAEHTCDCVLKNNGSDGVEGKIMIELIIGYVRSKLLAK